MSSFLRPSAASSTAPGAAMPAAALGGAAGAGLAPPGGQGEWRSALGDRGWALPLIAGVGVLLLAMGVGVLIGRSASSSPKGAAAQVITVGGASTPGPANAAAESFTSDWPSGRSGYTVQLQTLPQAGTTPAQVAAAKAAATAKGASGVGALRASEFSSVKGSGYVIYAGVDHTRSQAQKALAGLHKNFPSAKVIRVANGGGSTSSSSIPANGSGSDISHPAPPTVLQSLKNSKGKSYEERSKKLPNVVSTG